MSTMKKTKSSLSSKKDRELVLNLENFMENSK